VTIKLVLVEDHEVVRQGLRALLAVEPDFEIVGEAGDGLVAMELVTRLRPDVLVLDLMLPGLPGLDVVRAVRQSAPETRVVILSMHANEAYVLGALQAGAVGYVLKKSGSVELLAAIRAAWAGRRYLSPPLSEAAIQAYVEKSRATPDPYQTLTAREREVLLLLVEGLTSAEIAGRLVLSHRTVEMHRSRLMHKLGLDKKTDLIRYAIKRGLLPLED
jgi:two-component system, NarL family, response regulator NreC